MSIVEVMKEPKEIQDNNGGSSQQQMSVSCVCTNEKCKIEVFPPEPQKQTLWEACESKKLFKAFFLS